MISLIVASAAALCLIGVLAGTTSLKSRPRVQKYAIGAGILLMIVAAILAMTAPYPR
jgi:hypothetical protein